MEQVDTITLERQVAGSSWRWRAASGRTGTSTLQPEGLRVGDRLVVGLRWRRASWQVTRYVRIPDHAWMPAPERDEPPAITVAGRPPSFVLDDRPVLPGDVRTALSHMNPRSTAAHDAGRKAKLRPAVVAWVDHEKGHAGIHFLFDVDSAVRREGLGRRLTGWREAGLRKPSVASTEQLVRNVDELGHRIGRLIPTDRAALGLAGEPPGVGPGA